MLVSGLVDAGAVPVRKIGGHSDEVRSAILAKLVPAKDRLFVLWAQRATAENSEDKLSMIFFSSESYNVIRAAVLRTWKLAFGLAMTSHYFGQLWI